MSEKSFLDELFDDQPEVEQSTLDAVMDGGGQMNAALRGAWQGATLNYADEMSGQGAVKQAQTQAALDRNRLAELLRMQAAGDVEGIKAWHKATQAAGSDDVYNAAREQHLAGDAAAREANPWTYGLSEFAGAVGTGGAAMSAVNAPLKMSAALGAVQGAGSSNPDNRLTGAAFGGALGLAGGFAGEKISKGVDALIADRALKRAAAGASTRADFSARATAAKKNLDRFGFLPGAAKGEISKSLAKNVDDGKTINQVVKSLSLTKRGPLQTKTVRQEIKRLNDKISTMRKPGRQQANIAAKEAIKDATINKDPDLKALWGSYADNAARAASLGRMEKAVSKGASRGNLPQSLRKFADKEFDFTDGMDTVLRGISDNTVKPQSGKLWGMGGNPVGRLLTATDLIKDPIQKATQKRWLRRFEDLMRTGMTWEQALQAAPPQVRTQIINMAQSLGTTSGRVAGPQGGY